MKEAGTCCPICVPSYGMCIDGEKAYYSGQIWNISQYEYCTCINEKIQCATVQCGSQKCHSVSKEYKPIHSIFIFNSMLSSKVNYFTIVVLTTCVIIRVDDCMHESMTV